MASRLSVDPGSVRIDNRYYDDIGDGWWCTRGGRVDGLHWMNPTRAGYFEKVFSQGGRSLNGLSLLDVGCGGGILSEELAKRGAHVTGVDLSVRSVQAAKRHAPAGAELRYAASDALRLPFADASFDAIVTSDFLEHVPDLQACVKEMARVLRPGGVLAFDTINRTFAAWLIAIGVMEVVLRVIPRHTHDRKLFVKPGEVKAALAGAGMTLVETRGLSPVGFPLANVVRAARGTLRFAITADHSVSYIGYATKP